MQTTSHLRLVALSLALTTTFMLAGARPRALGQPPMRAAADDPAGAILPSWIAPHVKFLADSALEGRDTGSRGYQIAANYVAAQFALLGLRPAGDNGTYFQKVPIRKSAVVAGSASLEIGRAGSIQPLQYDRDFFVHASGNDDGLDASGRLVFVGHGVTAPEYHYDDYASVDVRGAIVVFLTSTPLSLPRDVRAVHSLMTSRVRVAKQHGAAACILLMPNATADGTREHQIRQLDATTWLDREGHAHNLEEGEPYAIVSGPGAAAVLGTHTFEEITSHLKSGPYSFDLGARAALHARFEHHDSSTVNVAAILPGESGTEFVLYSAHLDHDGTSTYFKGDPVLHGALDNAGGVATILAVARAFTRLPQRHRSVLFLAVTGEEKGLVGSDYFVHNPTVVRSSIVADINCDNFLWYGPVKDIAGIGAQYSTLDEPFREAAARQGLQVSPVFQAVPHVFVLTDHYAFLAAGVPAVSIINGEQSGDGKRNGNEMFAEYMRNVHHTPRDSYDQPIDWDAAVTEVRFAFVLGREIADTGLTRPTLKPNAFFAPTEADIEKAALDQCPPRVPEGTRCHTERDANGSLYFVEKPPAWNGRLIVYAHGGPGQPPTLATIQGIAGASSLLMLPQNGYGVAMASYRDPSWHLDAYADDTDAARAAFVRMFGQPAHTYLEGISFGAQVADRTLERFPKNYDAVLIVAGALMGGWLDVTREIDFRILYEYYCRNAPDAGYPLWKGWTSDAPGPGTALRNAWLQRAHDCTGWDLPPAQRTAAQQRALANIEGVTHWRVQDFAKAVLASYIEVRAFSRGMAGGANVFSNVGVRYHGSEDDNALNAGVPRYGADTALVNRVYRETTPRGLADVPIITSHSINDPRVPVEAESFYRDEVRRAGHADRLLQVFTTRANHPGTSNHETLALFEALDRWVTTKERPTADQIAALCESGKPIGETCTFKTGYTPPPLSSIIATEGREAYVGGGPRLR